MTFKEVAVLAGSGVAGALYCLGASAVVGAFGMTPHFPAHGGEADFEFRFTIFLAGVLPSFVLMGVLIGRIAWRGRPWRRILLGCVAGSILASLLGWVLAPAIASLPSRASSNGAAVAYLAGWTLMTFAGGLIAARGHVNSV
jgi:biotin transporter BioY